MHSPSCPQESCIRIYQSNPSLLCYNILIYNINVCFSVTPTIQTHPESTTFRENDTNEVVMYCLAVGMGYIQYHWEKYELSSGTWMELSHQAYATSSNLTFSIISEEDEGSYRCVATNFDGSTASRNATLRVYGGYYVMCIYV